MNRLNPTAEAILGLIPTPNVPGTSTGLNNFIIPTYSKVQYSQQVGRVDHLISQTERLSARGERNGDEAPGGPTGFLGTLAYGAGYAARIEAGASI